MVTRANCGEAEAGIEPDRAPTAAGDRALAERGSAHIVRFLASRSFTDLDESHPKSSQRRREEVGYSPTTA